jgi:hypothetical protein
MKRYEIEVIHEPSGAYLNYVAFTEESDPDFYKSFINDISIVIVDKEEVGDEDVDTRLVI